MTFVMSNQTFSVVMREATPIFLVAAAGLLNYKPVSKDALSNIIEPRYNERQLIQKLSKFIYHY